MAMFVRAEESALVTHTRFQGGVGARRTWAESGGTLIALVLLCCSGKGIGKRMLTGRDVEGASNVVKRVSEGGLGIITIRIGVWTGRTVEMAVLSS